MEEVELIAPSRKMSHKQNIVYRSTTTSKNKLEEEEVILPPLRSRGVLVLIVGFPPTKSCEKGETKLTTHIMQDSTLCSRRYLSLRAPNMPESYLSGFSPTRQRPPYAMQFMVQIVVSNTI